ncbi:MAG: ATP-binding response regulator [Anaerolineae bacterium]
MPAEEAEYSILLVLEDSTQGSIYAQALQRRGYQVWMANDGEEGLERLRTRKPSLAILDALLPKRDGFVICEHAKADPSLAGISIILLSPFDVDAVKPLRENGLVLTDAFFSADLVLQKPVPVEQLLEVVERVREGQPAASLLPPEEPKHTVLLIDDDRLNTKLLEVTLADAGFRVMTALSGKEGLQLFRREQPDLVMLDMLMSDLHGLSVLTTLKRRAPALPVIIMTAHGSEEMAVEAMKLGASDYLVKPLHYQRVAAVVREHIEKSRLRATEERLTHQLRESSLQLMRRVAELELARRRLEQAHAELEEAGRLKTEFISMVSHELRTPLTNIQGYVELLLDETDGPITDTQREYLEIVLDNCKRLIAIANDLLDISRIEAGNLRLSKTRLRLQELVEEAVRSWYPQFQAKNLQLSLDLTPQPLWIWADWERMLQVLNNLLSNACKYTPAGGSVTVRVYPSNDKALVEVIDTGIGIPEQDLERIFEKFYRAESSRQEATYGTGLGLPIAKSLVELHDGSISVTSKLSQGSTFTVQLPLLKG